MRFVPSLHMVDYVEDWSRVRSPSRAIRRMARGFRQNVRVVAVPKKEALTLDGGETYLIHPEALRALREAAPETEWRTT